MATHIQQPGDTALESHPHLVSIRTVQIRLTAQWRLLRQKIIHWLVTKPELTVKQKIDRSGNVFWYLYDPLTDRTVCLASEEEVRVWLEERFYYQNYQSQAASMSFNCHQSGVFR